MVISLLEYPLCNSWEQAGEEEMKKNGQTGTLLMADGWCSQNQSLLVQYRVTYILFQLQLGIRLGRNRDQKAVCSLLKFPTLLNICDINQRF